ncbi:MAG: cysteine-rich small domain-containing protein [Eubacterium sp.]|nr:cysteine-rich small domain-containing protein [Eubacterium sp.]
MIEKSNDYSYFKNINCEYFPCHKIEGDYFNCLFCFCPLYTLGDKCGGNFTYNEKGIKDCSACTLPHSDGGYDYITKKFPELSSLAKKNIK